MTNPAVNTGLLYKFFVKLDFRDKKKAGFKKLIGVLIAYLFANTFLSFSTSRSFDEDSYIILSMSTNVFILAFVVINDFINLFTTKDEGEVIHSLPIRSENIFFAKFFAAYTLILFYAASIIIPQIYFYTAYNSNILPIVSFVISLFLFSVLIISLLVLLYTLVLRYFTKAAHIVVYVVNILFLIYVFYSTSLKGKASSLGRSSVLDFAFVNFLPQAFFARGVNDPLITLILLVSAAAMGFLAFYTIKVNYRTISAYSSTFFTKEKSHSKKKKEGLDVNFADKIMNMLFLRNNLQRSAYYLLKYQLENSRVLKMRYYVFAFMPVVFTLIAVFADIPGAVIFPAEKLPFVSGRVSLLSPGILLLFVMFARLVISNTRIADSNSNGVDWMFESLPVGGPGNLCMGVLKYVAVYFFIPVAFVIGVTLSIKMDVTSIICNLTYALAAVFFISSVLFSMDKSYPLTLDSVRMDSIGKFLEVLLTIVLGGVIFASMLFIFKNIIFIIISIAVLLTAGSFILKIQRKS